MEESNSEAEESGSESSSCSSELEEEVKPAKPSKKTEPDANTSQTISLPELNSKDSEEE